MTAPPPGWRVLPIAQTLASLPTGKSVQQGWSPQCEAKPAGESEWGVLKTTAIQLGRFDDTQHKRLPDAMTPRPTLEVEQGDLLLTNAGPRARCAIPCLVRHTRGRLMLSGKIYRFRADPAVIDPYFLELFLLSPDAQLALDNMKTGISDSGLNLTRGRFLDLPVVVPPIEEQRRIVDILEDHLSRLDVADSALLAARARAANLLDSWLASSPVIREAAHCPLGGVLAEPLRHGRSVPTALRGFPVLRLTSIRDGRVDLRESKLGNWTLDEARPYMVARGDFLVSRGNGSLHLVGRGGLVAEEPGPIAFPDTAIRVRVDPDRIDGRFLALVWDSREIRRQIESVARTTAGIHKINQSDMRAMMLPVPDIAAQRRLAAEAADLSTGHARLIDQLLIGQTRFRTLRAALLQAAFSGQLTRRASDLERAEASIAESAAASAPDVSATMRETDPRQCCRRAKLHR